MVRAAIDSLISVRILSQAAGAERGNPQIGLCACAAVWLPLWRYALSSAIFDLRFARPVAGEG